MSTLSPLVRHTFGGGLATELGSGAELSPGASGTFAIPYLLRAENVFFLLNGGIRKIGGASKVNSSTLESGEQIRGMTEYVRQGVGGSPTRKRVCVVGTTIKKDDSDGAFTDIFTGIANDSVPCFTTFEDTLIISTDADEAPKEWDQTTATTLGGSPPNFAFSVVHANRLWASGNRAFPSRVYYSSLLNAEEWNGAGDSGTIDVDPEDGDVVVGLYAFRGELLVFKGGGGKGSIHRIQGLEPADFERRLFVPKIAIAGHNLIFDLGSDVGFVCRDGTIRTLLASEKFGDFEQGNLAQEIQGLMETVNFTALKNGWAATDARRGYTLFTLPVDGSSEPNLTLMMDTRFERPRFSKWLAVEAWSLAVMSDPSSSNRLIIYAGGNDGFIRKLQQTNRSIDDTDAISALFQTPFLHYGTPNKMKTIKAVGLGVQPTGNYDTTFAFRRDSGDSQETITTSGSDVLGPSSVDPFTLDTSTLAGDQYRTIWREIIDSGQFREVSYTLSNVELNEDLNVQSINIVLETSQEESYE